jgi:importin subunit alpha-2
VEALFEYLIDCLLCMSMYNHRFNNLNDEDNLSVTRQAIWCLSVLTWKPMDERFGIPIALKLMSALRWLNLNPYSADYVQSANNILLASSKLTEGGVRTVDAILGCEVIPFFVGLLKDNPFELNKAYAVQTLANIVAGTEAQTQAVIDAGILAFLPSLLDFDEVKDIRKDAAWICSNVAAGSTTQVDALVVTSRILESLVFIGMEDLLSIRQEATWALANLCVGNGRKYIPQLVRVDGLGPLVAILSTPHVGEEMLCDVLDALCTVLKDCGDARYIIEEFEGPDLLGDLANDFAGQSIGHKAAAVLRFFSHDLEGAEDENLAPKTAGEMFAFGMDKTPGANEKQQLYSFGDSSNALD